MNDSKVLSFFYKEAIGRFWIDPEGSHCWHGNKCCFSNNQNREAFWHHPPNIAFSSSASRSLRCFIQETSQCGGH